MSDDELHAPDRMLFFDDLSLESDQIGLVLSGVSGELRGVRASTSGSVGTDQKSDLDSRNEGQNASEPRENLGIERDPFVRRVWLDFGFGALAGAAWCLLCWAVLR
jgi:hypothetical protein